MAITKDLEIKINGDKAAFTDKFYIYQNDRGIELNIKVSVPKLQISKRNTSFLTKFEGSSGGARILKPNGSVIDQNNIHISDNFIKFTINHELTDDLDEIGISIPPIQFEVKKLLANIDEDDMSKELGRADFTNADTCFVSDDGKEMEIFVDGKYIKTVWESGDLITSVKLNKIEEAIEYLDSELTQIKERSKNTIYIGSQEPEDKGVLWIDDEDEDIDTSLDSEMFAEIKNL